MIQLPNGCYCSEITIYPPNWKKGGTSLPKGYKIIDRFSEDIDIHIKPPKSLNVNENPKSTNCWISFYPILPLQMSINPLNDKHGACGGRFAIFALGPDR